MRKSTLLVTVVFGLFFGLAESSASSGSFYKDKTIRYVISMGPGGGFDLYGRLLARHMGRYIPGHPRFLVQNMPGAGSLIAANRIFQEQPGDGLTMVMLHFAVVSQALVGHPQAKFDPLKYIWIGDPSIGGLPQVIWMRSDLPIRKLNDFRKAEKPWNLGSTGVGIGSAMSAELLKLVGFPIRLIAGYKSSSDVMAALERKELDGYSVNQVGMIEVFGRYIDSGMIRPVLAIGKEPRVAPLPGVPFLEDLDMSSQSRALIEFFASSQQMFRVHAVPPGTPPDRVKILREAFLRALQDPALLEEAEKMKITISPTSGHEVMRAVEQLANASPQVKEAYRLLLGLN